MPQNHGKALRLCCDYANIIEAHASSQATAVRRLAHRSQLHQVRHEHVRGGGGSAEEDSCGGSATRCVAGLRRHTQQFIGGMSRQFLREKAIMGVAELSLEA